MTPDARLPQPGPLRTAARIAHPPAGCKPPPRGPRVQALAMPRRGLFAAHFRVLPDWSWMTFRRALAAALIGTGCMAGGTLRAQAQAPSSEILHYSAEWRFVHAGEIELQTAGLRQTHMKLVSAGLVSRLFRVQDDYTVARDELGCSQTLDFQVREGRRSRDIHSTFDKDQRKATYLERDVAHGTIVTQKESDIPGCVMDATGGLNALRARHPAPGTTWDVPISDGKKTANIHVEAQDKETIRTPLGQFPSTRYEAFMFSGAFYGRKGRLFVWITDDERRLPIQLKIQLPFYVGTITLQLEKVDRE
jgi:hypothetical protein